MAYMIKRNPYWRDTFGLERVLNRMMEMETEALPSGFPLDVIENEQEYQVKASIAGFEPDKIDITYDDNTLSIRGEVKNENLENEKSKYHVRERNYGSFYRGISLPGVIDADKITAENSNGILTVHLPKKPETQPRKININ